MNDPVFIQHLAEVLEQLREISRSQDRELSAINARMTALEESIRRLLHVVQEGNGESLITRMVLVEKSIEDATEAQETMASNKWKLISLAVPGILALIGQIFLYFFQK